MIRLESDTSDGGVVAWLRKGEIAIDIEPMLLADFFSCGVTITNARALRLADALEALTRGEGKASPDCSDEGVAAWLFEDRPSLDVATAYVVQVGVKLTTERCKSLAADLRELVAHRERGGT